MQGQCMILHLAPHQQGTWVIRELLGPIEQDEEEDASPHVLEPNDPYNGIDVEPYEEEFVEPPIDLEDKDEEEDADEDADPVWDAMIKELQGQGEDKRKRNKEKEVIPTNKPLLSYFDIANDPFFIKA